MFHHNNRSIFGADPVHDRITELLAEYLPLRDTGNCNFFAWNLINNDCNASATSCHGVSMCSESSPVYFLFSLHVTGDSIDSESREDGEIQAEG